MFKQFHELDKFLIRTMHKYGVPLLRVALGIVFLWFGALKVFGVSPVADLIANTYSFFPTQGFIITLGLWEMAIGLGLIFKIALRTTLALLWLQILGTFVAPFLNPHLFFSQGNLLLLTANGEFVVKNLVLITAGIVIGGHEVV